MDDVGNVLVKRITRGTAVSIKNTTEESAVSNDILKLSNGVLSPDQPYKVRVPTYLFTKIHLQLIIADLISLLSFDDFLSFFQVFDMKKFQQNMSRELKRSSPDRLKLENQCISAIAFGSSDVEEGEGDDNR